MHRHIFPYMVGMCSNKGVLATIGDTDVDMCNVPFTITQEITLLSINPGSRRSQRFSLLDFFLMAAHQLIANY